MAKASYCFPEDDLLTADAIQVALRTLRDREAFCARAWFGLAPFTETLTYAEIGALFGVGRERVRQMLNRALRKLGHPSRRQMFDDSPVVVKGKPQTQKRWCAKTPSGFVYVNSAVSPGPFWRLIPDMHSLQRSRP